MKRMWIGVALLLTVLTVGICLSAAFSFLHRPLTEKLEAASVAAMEGDWETATSLTGQARDAWERFRKFTAAVADHEPLEEMDSMFAQLEVLGALRETDEFAAGCAHLASLARAMADSQQVTWWSLL